MRNKPLLWVPTLYLAEGIPYTIVNATCAIFMKNKGMDNDMIAMLTGWMYLPWVIKPLWSPLVEMVRTSKFWIVLCQIVMGGALASIGITVASGDWLIYCMTALWIVAFMSATHDIAADGYYIEALDSEQQSIWVGLRSTFYKIAMMLGQGALVVLAGWIEESKGVDPAWMITFSVAAAAMVGMGLYHWAVLSRKDRVVANGSKPERSILELLKSYFQKKHIGLILLFLLLYRLGESQLSKIAPLFLLDDASKGGLGLGNDSVGLINGTFGLIAMSLGGILGGVLIGKQGFGKWLIPMILTLNLPDAFYAIMSAFGISNFWAVSSMVSLEQFGYGFGFAAYSVFMLKISQGEYKTAHYSISTAFMALGMMLPGMVSGYIQQAMGYTGFFIWVLLCCVPSVIVALMVKKRMQIEN